jgi:2-hydroxychromene-2-carboxylate isomerase
MSELTLDPYTQDLYDKVASLRREVANLHTAYKSADRQLNAMSHLADKTTSDAVKEAIVAEEFVSLALESAQAAYQAAQHLGNPQLIEMTKNNLALTQAALDYASASTSINAARQTSGGGAKGR